MAVIPDRLAVSYSDVRCGWITAVRRAPNKLPVLAFPAFRRANTWGTNSVGRY